MHGRIKWLIFIIIRKKNNQTQRVNTPLTRATFLPEMEGDKSYVFVRNGRFDLTYLTYAVHAGGGPRDGFCMVTVSQVDLSVASLDASVRLVIDLVLQTWEMQSSHLLGGRPLGLWHLTLPSSAVFGYRVFCILLMRAKYFNLFTTILFSTSWSRLSGSLIFGLRILSSLVTPSMRRRHVISKTWRRLWMFIYNIKTLRYF